MDVFVRAAWCVCIMLSSIVYYSSAMFRINNESEIIVLLYINASITEYSIVLINLKCIIFPRITASL